MAEGTMGGAPSKKAGGSMLPAGFVDDKKREKELASLEEATGKQDRVEEDKEEQKEEARKKKIDDLLPEEVETAYGLLSYKKFKEVYADVYEGVKEKDHWATGFVTHTANLPGGTPFKLRNFRRSEGDAIRALQPRSSAFAGGDSDDFYKENSRFVAVRIIVALMEFDGNEQVPLPTLTIDSIDEWFGKDTVKKSIAFLDGLPDQLVTFMDGVVNDIMVAYNAAATENLKNQLAPLSDSTE
jgi:hypothetical protein